MERQNIDLQSNFHAHKQSNILPHDKMTDIELIEKIMDILKQREYQKPSEILYDVIIPIYNAYSDFLKCLYSTLKYQDRYGIICINDKSTDNRIEDLFSKIKSFENQNIVLISNPTNSGFVKTVNIGMKYSKNDIILLNSDTIVTKDWAVKLSHCAYSDEKIATVTPFSNNATICSIPNFNQNNIVPEGFTIDEFADFIEKVSLKQYPEIPTAVGFCMYIKRSVINEIGYFDEVVFGKGYGEENDFSMRAIKAGYKNVLCDDTFIFHRGAASFSTAQSELMEKNLEILSERYPEYLPKVAKFCMANTLKRVHDNINFRMKTWDNTGKKRILFILHHFGGGTEYHVMDLINSLKSVYIFYILKVENNKMILTEFNNDRKLRYIFPLYHLTNFNVFYDEEINKIYHKIINTFHINLIHIHHLFFHTLDIFDIAEEQEIPLLMTFHDYYSVCPSVNLLDEKYKYCNYQNSFEKCNKCLSERLGLSKDFIKHWRENFQKAIIKCDLIIAPNPSVFEIIKKYYQIPNDKTLVIEHGHRDEIFASNDSSSDPEIYNLDNKFHIAFIGSLGRHKGSKIFYAMAKSKKLNKKTCWSIFGDSDIDNSPGYNSYYNIHNYGKYDYSKELKFLLKSKKVDLIFFPSICPETFSYTLSEAWGSGIPVLVSDLGALKERVDRTGGGWTIDVSDLNKVEEKILEIIESPEDFKLKKEAIKKIRLKKLDEMQNEYYRIYSKQILSSKPIYSENLILSNYKIIDSLVKVPDKTRTPTVSQHNILIRAYKCIQDNGIKYSLRLGYIKLYDFIMNLK